MSRKKKTGMPPEWSCPFVVEDIPPGGMHRDIAANAEERALLAVRLGVVSLDALTASLDLAQEKGSAVVHVTGMVKAQITQECVVSNQPIVSSVEEPVEAWFADPDQVVPFSRGRQQQQIKKGNLEIPMLEEQEDPEPIVGGVIDLGELATQFLSLAIDPYPHAPGVAYEYGDDLLQEPAKDLTKNPFAALKAWKDRMMNGDKE